MARRPRGASISQTIGGVLVGFDEQVWSQRPPGQERVERVQRLGTVIVPGGLTVELPVPLASAAAAESPASSDAGASDATDWLAHPDDPTRDDDTTGPT